MSGRFGQGRIMIRTSASHRIFRHAKGNVITIQDMEVEPHRKKTHDRPLTLPQGTNSPPLFVPSGGPEVVTGGLEGQERYEGRWAEQFIRNTGKVGLHRPRGKLRRHEEMQMLGVIVLRLIEKLENRPGVRVICPNSLRSHKRACVPENSAIPTISSSEALLDDMNSSTHWGIALVMQLTQLGGHEGCPQRRGNILRRGRRGHKTTSIRRACY